MAPHKVPTHLDVADGIGRFSFRTITVGVAGYFAESNVLGMVPTAGPRIGDLLALRYPDLGLQGALPIEPVAAALVVAAPFVALAWPSSPPAEHGLGVFARYLSRRGLLSSERVDEILGHAEVDGDRIVSDYGYHAAWEIPSQNLRLADGAATQMAQDLWAQFLRGLTAPIMTLTTARRVDAQSIIGNIGSYPRPQARALASWLSTQILAHQLLERHHYLAFCAEDEHAFDDTEQEVLDGLGGLGLRTDLIRRLRGDELRDVARRIWSKRPAKAQELHPAGPWNNTPRQLQSDGEWHEVMTMSKWPRVIPDNALASYIDGSYEVDVIQHIEPIDPDAVLGGLERRLNGMNSSNQNQKRKTAIEDLGSFVQSIESGIEQPFSVSVLFHMHNESREAVVREAQRLESRARRSGARAANVRWEQADALLASSLLAVNNLRARHKRVDTSSVSHLYPFCASACWPDGSIPWGEALESHRNVGWSCWARPWIPNPNLGVFAGSGGGKGFAVKVMLSRSLFAGITKEIYGFDQAEEEDGLGEYGRFAAYCGLDYRTIESLDDLDAALENLVAPGCIWNIAKLPVAARPEAFCRVKEALDQLSLVRKCRRQLVVDELWSFVQDAASIGADPAVQARALAGIEDLVRRGRWKLIGGVWMTQRVRDAIQNPVVQVIHSQASSQLYGMQNPQEITKIADDLQWTPAEAKAVRHFRSGQFLLVAGPWRVTMAVTASPEEYEMANTDERKKADASQRSARVVNDRPLPRTQSAHDRGHPCVDADHVRDDEPSPTGVG